MRPVWFFILCMLVNSHAAAFSLCIEDVDLPPMQLAQGDSAHAGEMPMRIHLAAQRVGQSIELQHTAWRRCIEQVRQGKTDAMAAVIWTAERDSWGAFPKPAGQTSGAPDPNYQVWHEVYPIFVPLESTLSYDGKTFSGLHTGIGAPPGYVVWNRLKEAGALSERVLQPDTGLRLVALKRLDGYVVERSIGTYLLKQQGIMEKVRELPALYQESDSYLVFSNQFQQKNPQLVKAIWAAVREIRAEQAIAKAPQ